MAIQPERGDLKTVALIQPQITASDVINNFAQSTSLLGIQQILRKKSITWLVAYIVCVIMSIVQSWHMTTHFFEMKTTQKFTIQSKEMMPFPSVSVCSNIVLPGDFDYSKVPNYNMSVNDFEKDKCISKSHRRIWVDAVIHNRLQILRYIRSLSVENRTSLGLDLRENFILKCHFAEKQCNFDDPMEFVFFNNPFYGNCFTFNPAYEDDTSKYADLTDRLDMEFNLEPTGYWLTRSKKPFVGVLIHEPGTAPILDLPSVHDVYGGEYIILTLELREKVFIKKILKNKPSCVYTTEQEYRSRSRYYSPDTPYQYSLEACMRSCYQDHAGEKCGLIDPTLPVQTKEYEKNRSTTMPPLVCNFDQRLTMEICNCPLPCHITHYDLTPDHNEVPTADCDEEEENDGDHNKGQRVRVGVNFLSNIYESVEEELEHTLSEFLGFLGGNMSLWIGLCVISLLEVFELVWNLLRVACKPKWPVVPVTTQRRGRPVIRVQPADPIAVHFPNRTHSSRREQESNFRSIYDYSTLRNATT